MVGEGPVERRVVQEGTGERRVKLHFGVSPSRLTFRRPGKSRKGHFPSEILRSATAKPWTTS